MLISRRRTNIVCGGDLPPGHVDVDAVAEALSSLLPPPLPPPLGKEEGEEEEEETDFGAATAGALIMDSGARSSAYLPAPLAIAVAADQWARLGTACVLAFFVPFVGTLLAARSGELALPDLDPFGFKSRVRRKV